MSAFRRILACSFDFALALFFAWGIVWNTLVLQGLLGFSGGAWADQMAALDAALRRFALQRGLRESTAALLGNLPWLLELALLLAAAALLVRLLRRFARVTPGEWTFSVRRPPLPPPSGGTARLLLRAAVGLVAFAAVLVLWSILDFFVLDPL